MHNRRLLVTTGEPAGIGPDILLQWHCSGQQHASDQIIAICDPALLEQRAESLGIDLNLNILNTPADAHDAPGSLNVLPCALAAPCVPGRLDTDNAAYVLQTLELASQLCLEKQADGIITGPVQKSVINDAGITFSGHTEFFAEQCSRFTNKTNDPVMMLATPGLRVALVTTHLPLRAVPDAVTPEKLAYCLEVLHAALSNSFGITSPQILVTGLNPHAGEQGHLGDEEINIIEPILDKYRAQGMRLTGPLPADTLFTDKHLADADAVLAMYHDQGLPVLKHKGFGQAVNITLGLPLIRTSVDHGTALDLAGTGQSDPSSFAYALQVATELTSHRQTAA